MKILFWLAVGGLMGIECRFLYGLSPEIFRQKLRRIIPWCLGLAVWSLAFWLNKARLDSKAEDVLMLGILVLFILYLIFRRGVALAASKVKVWDLKTRMAADCFAITWYWLAGVILIAGGVEGLRQAVLDLDFEVGDQMQLMMVQAVLSMGLMIGLVLRVLWTYPGMDPWKVLGLRGRWRPLWKTVFLPIFGAIVFAGVCTLILQLRPDPPSTPLSRALNTTEQPNAIVVFLLLALVFAPFLEEVVFRGYLFSVIEGVRGKREAVIGVSLAFAFLHVNQYWGDPLAILAVSLLGLTLAYFRVRAGQCGPGIIMHYVYNGAMTIFPVLLLAVQNPYYFQYRFSAPSLPMAEKVRLLEESLRYDPRHADSYNDLAWLYAEEGRHLEEALALIEKALSLRPNHFAYLDTKAEILARMGRVDEAVDVAGKLVQRYPENEYLKARREYFKGLQETLKYSPLSRP